MRKYFGKAKCGLLMLGLTVTLSTGMVSHAAETDDPSTGEGISQSVDAEAADTDDDVVLTDTNNDMTLPEAGGDAASQDTEDEADAALAEDAEGSDDETDTEEVTEEVTEEEQDTDADQAEETKTATKSDEGKKTVSSGSGVQGIASVQTIQVDTETAAKAGFYTDDNGNKCYRDENGKQVKNKIVLVEDKEYYLDTKGILVVSKNFFYQGTGYRANAKGVLSVKTGWLVVGDKKYYTDAKGVPYKEAWIGNTYYLGKDGAVVKNTILSHDGNLYYMGETGQWQKDKGWVKYKNKNYYISSTGYLLKGLAEQIDGKWYCFGDDGAMLKKQIVMLNQKLCYLGVHGYPRAQKGWVFFNNKWYYTDKQGYLICNGIVIISNSERYYMGAKGAMVTNKIVTYNGKMYLARKNGTLRTKKGWFKRGKAWYYSETDGAFRTDDFAKSKGNTYYLGSDGKMVTKSVILHDTKAYYAAKSGILKSKRGWFKLGGSWYYGLKNGELKRNTIQVKKGKNRFLGDLAAMVVSDGVVTGGKAYTADKNGVLKAKTGWVKANGLWYRAKKNSKVVTSQFLTVGGKEYYFDETGVMQKGKFFIANKKLLYAESNGVVRRKLGWLQVGEKWYYSNSKGVFFRNVTKTIKGKRYYFHNDGSRREPSDYYDPTGIADTSWTEINGRRYHLDKNGNIDSLLGIDISAWQDDIDWKKVAADGIDFAFIRVGGRFGASGEIYDDSLGVKNIKEATAAGIPVGVYFFTQAITVEEAIEEAEYTLEKIKGLDVTLPVVIDSENMKGGRHGTIDSKTRTNIIKAFCETVEKAGYNAMYYAGMAWCVDGYVDVTKLTNYMHWCAQYWIRNQCDDFGVPYQIWQYSDSGSVDGIKGNVDMNIWYTNH